MAFFFFWTSWSFTFKNTSIIDYTVISAEALKFNIRFWITELDTLFTDHHSLLSTTLTFLNKINLRKTPECKSTQKPKWKENTKSDFVLNLNDSKIEAAMDYLEFLVKILHTSLKKI